MENRGVYVKKSSIHGLGLYALRRFRAGEIVLRWNLSRVISRDEFDSLAENEKIYTHPLDNDRILIVQPPERFVNHSCENNTVVRDFCDVAIRDIAPDEEITSDYASDASGSKFRCLCGSVNCRETVN